MPGLTEEQRLAIVEVRRAQAQYEAVIDRMEAYRSQFRVERDEAVKKAVDLKVPKLLLANELKVSNQWLNKLLRGEAYR